MTCPDCDGEGEAPRSQLGACLVCPTCNGAGQARPRAAGEPTPACVDCGGAMTARDVRGRGGAVHPVWVCRACAWRDAPYHDTL
jgi:DnaJ-class molecular chaperone